MSRMSELDIERQNAGGHIAYRIAKTVIFLQLPPALMDICQLTPAAAGELFAMARSGLVPGQVDQLTEAEAREVGRLLRSLVVDFKNAADHVAQQMTARREALAAPQGLAGDGDSDDEIVTTEDPEE